MDDSWDCVIVGGGGAGLGAALVLGRARRRVLLLDAGKQSNLASHRIGGVLGTDGLAPAEFYARGRAAIGAYGSVELEEGVVAGAGRDDGGGFTLATEAGDRLRSQTVLLATGMEYRYPDVPGLTERWGGSVFHCPFCHGWEVRDQVLGVLDGSPAGVHRALLLRAWTDRVTLFTNGPADISPEQARQLEAAGIAVDERPVAAVHGPTDDTLESVVFMDGSEQPVSGLLVQISLHQRSDLPRGFGAESVSNPMTSEGVLVDQRFATTVPGLFAAGDVTGTMPTLSHATAAGATVGAGIVGELFA